MFLTVYFKKSHWNLLLKQNLGSSPPDPWFCFPPRSRWPSWHILSSEGQGWPDTTSQCLCSAHFFSSQRHFIISHPHKRKGQHNRIFWEKERERNHIPVVFTTVFCYYHSILFLVIAINLFLCLIYKLDFITGIICVGKDVVFSTICGFRHSLGAWNVSPGDTALGFVYLSWLLLNFSRLRKITWS